MQLCHQLLLEQLRQDMIARAMRNLSAVPRLWNESIYKRTGHPEGRADAEVGSRLRAAQRLLLGSDCEQHYACNGLYLRYLNSDPARPLIFRPTQDCYRPAPPIRR